MVLALYHRIILKLVVRAPVDMCLKNLNFGIAKAVPTDMQDSETIFPAFKLIIKTINPYS